MLVNLKQRWGPVICSWVPLDLWHRLLGVELVLPRYHLVSDQDLPHTDAHFTSRRIKQFVADVEFFLRFYNPVSLQNIINHLDGAGRLPKRCFLMTFDDGFREIYDVVAPILSSQGIPAVFFLNPSVLDNQELLYQQKQSLLIHALASLSDSSIEQEVSQVLINAGVGGPDLSSCIRNITYRQRHVVDDLGEFLGCDFQAYAAEVRPYLTSAQTRELIAKGFSIGAHSIDHPLYSELSLQEQLANTRDSIDYFSNCFQYECQSFAFPYRDTGVSSEFFREIFSDGGLKVTFGIHGMRHHFFPRNLERFTMEYPNLKAPQILAREFCTAFLRSPLWMGIE